MTYYEAQEALKWLDSYGRLPKMLEIFWDMFYQDWIKLLGEEWETFDNIGIYKKYLRTLLPTNGPVIEMMRPKEIKAFNALPDEITIYRGTGKKTMRGLSWSLSREVAAKFPSMLRYRPKGQPVLVTATVKKKHVLAIKLGRKEREIITFRPKIQSIEPLA